MQYARKIGVATLAVAAAFAVAFALLVSGPRVAEAHGSDTEAGVHVGDTIEITFASHDGTLIKVAEDSAVKGVFVANGSASLTCELDAGADEEADTYNRSDCDLQPGLDDDAEPDSDLVVAFRVTSVVTQGTTDPTFVDSDGTAVTSSVSKPATVA